MKLLLRRVIHVAKVQLIYFILMKYMLSHILKNKLETPK
jgi:hypothetical protein